MLNFLKNNITKDRIINSNTVNFFGLKYFANKIHTYKRFDNFTEGEKKIINETSPFFTQQTVIPINEYERLVDKFNKINPMIEYPKVIVIDKNNIIFNNHTIDEKIFCLYHSNNTFNLYKKIQFCE